MPVALTASVLTVGVNAALAYVKAVLVRVASVELKNASVLSAPVPVLQRHPRLAPVALPASVRSLEDAKEQIASVAQTVNVQQALVHVEHPAPVANLEAARERTASVGQTASVRLDAVLVVFPAPVANLEAARERTASVGQTASVQLEPVLALHNPQAMAANCTYANPVVKLYSNTNPNFLSHC